MSGIELKTEFDEVSKRANMYLLDEECNKYNLEIKEKRIKSEIRKLKKFTSGLTKDDQTIPNMLIEEIAFMKITLDELRKEVNKEGVVTIMCQGEYDITRENPALKSYNATIQRYNSSLKQLEDILNKIAPENKDERNIGAFIARKM